jgi:hypothetical protein
VSKTNLAFGDFEVEWDGTCWTIFLCAVTSEWKGRGRKPKEIGREYRRPIAYYAQLSPALVRLLDEKIGAAGAKGAGAVIETIAQAKREILDEVSASQGSDIDTICGCEGVD